MENINERSTTKNDFPTLFQLASKWIYYTVVNACMNLEKTYHGNYYCTCYKYSGCEK